MAMKVDLITDEHLRCQYHAAQVTGRHLFILGLGLVVALVVAEVELASIIGTYVANHPVGWPEFAGIMLGTGTGMAAVLTAAAKLLHALAPILPDLKRIQPYRPASTQVSAS